MFRILRSRRARVCTFLLSISAALLGPTRKIQAQPPAITPGLREILATGAEVPRLGRIGAWGFSLLGIADDGRLLVAGDLSDGRQGLFWAADHQLTPLWITGDTPGVTLDLPHVRAGGDGTVIAPAHADGQWNVVSFYTFAQGSPPRVLVPPATDQAGNTLCWFDPAVFAGNGGFAFQATIAPPGMDCSAFSDSPPPTAIYLANGEIVTRVLSSPDLGPSVYMITLLGLTRDGGVIASVYQGGGLQRIITVRNGVVRTLVATGDLGPAGAPFTYISAAATNGVGEVLFAATEASILHVYRTDQGRIINIDINGQAWALGDDGSVAVLRSSGADPAGVFLVGPTGDTNLVFALGANTGFARYVSSDGPLFFNAAGALAFAVDVYGGPTSMVALRWAAGQLDHVLVSGDPGPGETILAAGGLGSPICLAPDGRMVVDATTINGADALLCVDGMGPHVITQAGDPAPDGSTFVGFYGPCAFTDDGAIIFGGWSAVPDGNGGSTSQNSMYRASVNGVEHVLGEGDAVSNGTRIQYFSSGFISNRRGSLLVGADAGEGIYLWHDGRLDMVRYGSGVAWGLTDQDEVVLSSGDTLLVWSHGLIRIALMLDSLPGGPFVSLDNLAVRGDLILFSMLDRFDLHKHQFLYRLGNAQAQEIPGANLAGGIVDFTPGGHILSPTAGGFQLIAPTGDVMGFLSTPPEIQAFGLNDAGTIALLGYGVPTGGRRYTLEIAGPGPSANCPLLPTPGGPTATPTPIPTPDLTPISSTGSSRAYVADAAADIVAAIDTATQSVLAVVPVPHRPSALAAAPDGSRVYVLAGDKLGVIDARTAQLMATIPLVNEASVIGAGPDDHTVYAALYVGRIARINTSSGTISSVLMPARCRPLGFAPGGGTLVATILTGSSFAPHADLAVIDTATGQIVGSSDGCSNTSGVGFSTDGNLAYVLDDCRNAVEVIDVHTAQVVNVLANEQWSGHIAIASDGSRAYTTHSGGSVSVIELTQNGVSTIAVPGAPDQLALTPDGGLLYVTTTQSTQSPLGQVAVIDTASKSLLTTILLDGWPTDVIVAPAPPAAVPPPTPTVPSTAAVLLRADNVEGVTGDVVPFTVRLDTYDREVGSVEAHLLSTTNEPFLQQPDGRPDCALAPGVAGTATFEFEPPSCWGANCYSLHFVVRGIDATQSLPHSGTLFTCSLWIRFQWPAIAPLLLLHSTATAPDGAPIAVTSGDGSVTVLSLDQATPRPTRTAWPTATSTATPTLTATPLPAVVSIDSIVVPAGTARAAMTIRLQTNAAHIAGEQNDIVVSNPALVAANGDGAPACTVNPAINKPDTAFAFLPPGCQPDHGECIGIRSLVFAFDNVAAIPDGSVLYSCEVTLLDTAPGVSLPLQLANVHASDPAGNAVPVVGQDGTLTITAAAPPTVTRAPAATPTSTPTVGRNGGPALAGGASDPNVAAPTTGGGCTISPAYNASSNGWLFAGVATLVIRRRLRTEGKRRRW